MKATVFSKNRSYTYQTSDINEHNLEDINEQIFFEKFEESFTWNFKYTQIKGIPDNSSCNSNGFSKGNLPKRVQKYKHEEKVKKSKILNKENSNPNDSSQNEPTYTQNLKNLLHQTSKEYFDPEKFTSRASINILKGLAKKKTEEKSLRNDSKERSSKGLQVKLEAQIKKSMLNLQEKPGKSSRMSFFDVAREKLLLKISQPKDEKASVEAIKSKPTLKNAVSHMRSELEATKKRSISSIMNANSSFRCDNKEEKLEKKVISHSRQQRSTTFNSKSFW